LSRDLNFETETWWKFRDRDWDFIKKSESRDLKFETETRYLKIRGLCRNFS